MKKTIRDFDIKNKKWLKEEVVKLERNEEERVFAEIFERMKSEKKEQKSVVQGSFLMKCQQVKWCITMLTAIRAYLTL